MIDAVFGPVGSGNNRTTTLPGLDSAIIEGNNKARRRGSFGTASTEDSTNHRDDATLSSHQSTRSAGSVASTSNNKKPNFTMVVSKPHRAVRNSMTNQTGLDSERRERMFNPNSSKPNLGIFSASNGPKQIEEVVWWGEPGESGDKAPSSVTNNNSNSAATVAKTKKKTMTKVKASDLANLDLSQFRTKDGRPMDANTIQAAMAALLAQQQQGEQSQQSQSSSSKSGRRSSITECEADVAHRRSRSRSVRSPRREPLDSANQAAQEEYHREEDEARKRSKSVSRGTNDNNGMSNGREADSRSSSDARRSRSTVRRRSGIEDGEKDQQIKERDPSRTRARSKSRSPGTSAAGSSERPRDRSVGRPRKEEEPSFRKALDRKSSSNIAQRRARSKSRARVVKEPSMESFDDPWNAFEAK